jgi:hypothetical protein
MRRAWIKGELLRHGGSCRDVDAGEQRQRKLGVAMLLLSRVRPLLHVEVGQYAEQRGADVDAFLAGERDQAVEIRHGRQHPSRSRKSPS